jgi:hypothetical protein
VRHAFGQIGITILQLLVKAAIVDIDDVPAAEGEDGFDTLCLQGTGNQVPATNFSIVQLLSKEPGIAGTFVMLRCIVDQDFVVTQG